MGVEARILGFASCRWASAKSVVLRSPLHTLYQIWVLYLSLESAHSEAHAPHRT